jgi:hypothetical protein
MTIIPGGLPDTIMNILITLLRHTCQSLMQFISHGELKNQEESKLPITFRVYMNLDCFTSLMLKIVDNEFPMRDIPICYNLSMRLQINEIKGDRIFNMTFPEFLEAYARAIDKFSPIPYGDSPSNWTLQDRQEQPLYVKIENVMLLFMKCINHPDYKYLKDKFVHPMKDEIGLFKYDINSPFYTPVWPKVHSRKKVTSVVNNTKKMSSNNKLIKV